MYSTLEQWLGQHTGLLGVVAALSIGLLLLSIVVTPRLVARLPRDYLQREAVRAQSSQPRRLLIGAFKAVIGTVLIAIGLVMLIAPGPGLVTLLIGISIAPFPGKYPLFRRIAAQQSVYNSLNWMRKRHGQGPLLHPFAKDTSG